MDAEQIVRALAAADPKAFDSQEERTCGLCWPDGEYPNLDDPEQHRPDCPWRLAREWVAANPTVVLATASAPLFEDDPPTN